MRLLVDTHVLIWAIATSRRLSARARAALADRSNQVLVSAVSAYEIEYKRSRDPVLQRLPQDLDPAIMALGFEWAPILPAQALAAGRLPRDHRDPWDRVLAAQAILLDADVVTTDPQLEALGARVLW